MKTKLLIILWIVLPLLGFSQVNTKEFKWVRKSAFSNNFDISYLPEQDYKLYYLLKNYIKITSNKNYKPTKVEFENGDVEKISDSVYCIIPRQLGRFLLKVNDDYKSYVVSELPIEKIKYKLSASTSPFPDCISIDDLNNSKKVIAFFNYNYFKIKTYRLMYSTKLNDTWMCNSNSLDCSDTLSQVFKKYLKENVVINSRIYFGVSSYLYDTVSDLNPTELKVIDSYQNEFIRRAFKTTPLANHLNLMKNDLRIKITGNPQREDIKAIQEIADELNTILETIKVKIVDKQPSLTIVFDTKKHKKYSGFKSDSLSNEKSYRRNIDSIFKRDSLLFANGYEKIFEGFLKKESNKFFPFNKRYIMYFNDWFSEENLSEQNISLAKYILRRNIIGLLFNFYENKISYSYADKYKENPEFYPYQDEMLRILYSKDGENKIKAILSEGKVEKQKSPVYILLLVLTIILLFVFSEIYNYYNIVNFIGKVRVKIIKRIIEAILVAQIPIVAYLILEVINNGTKNLISETLFLETMLIPFCLLIGIFLFFLDMLLKKIKFLWLNILANLTLSFFSVALAYQLMYFFITPELIKLSVISWEILLIPLLITLYRLYAGFQTNKIAGLLQEKELELSKQKELKFKSDLNALQARINPHFLYNALNSLASLTHIDQNRTEKMALSLSKLFRYNINKTEEHYASLKDEIEMAEIYLQIEKNRFEDKLNYSIEIQEELKEFIIPRFILQPLAENAVKHGISKITGQGIIKIKIFEEANKVIMEIYDNGPDFPGGLISGYGLQNTYEKLKLLYKKAFDISFINTPEKKLVITLTK